MTVAAAGGDPLAPPVVSVERTEYERDDEEGNKDFHSAIRIA
jgi:hypothetical protein